MDRQTFSICSCGTESSSLIPPLWQEDESVRKGGSHSHRPYMSLKPLSHSRDPGVQIWTLTGLNHFSVAVRLPSLLFIAMQDAS